MSCRDFQKALSSWAPLLEKSEENEGYEPFGQWLQIACKETQEKLIKAIFPKAINTHGRVGFAIVLNLKRALLSDTAVDATRVGLI